MSVERSQQSKAWAAVAGAVVLYLLFQVLPLLAHQFPGGYQNDFKHLYAGSWLLAHGGNPYDAAQLQDFRATFESEDARFGFGILPYVYLPFTGLVMSPLTTMRFGSAVVAWQLLNHALFLGGLALAACAGGWRFTWKSVALIGAAAVWNFSVQRQNSAGQLNMVLFFGMALMAVGLARNWHPAAVGGIAAFLALFKITPGIFLVYFLMRRQWRHAAWMAGIGTALLLLCVLIVGPRVHLDFLPLLADMGFGKSTWAAEGMTFWRDPYNQSLNAFFHRALVAWEGHEPWLAVGERWANALTMACALGILGLCAWLWGKRGTESERMTGFDASGFSVAVMASLLIPSLMWDHYLVQALLPAVLLWNHPAVRERRWTRGLLAACVVLFSTGVEFGALRLHAAMLGQPLLLVPGDWRRPVFEVLFGGVALPGAQPLGALLQSLKLWPALALLAVGIHADRHPKDDGVE